MNFEQRIKQIKELHSKAIIERAKAEERIKGLEEQKEKVIANCNELGVDPESLETEIKNQESKIEELLRKAEATLGLSNIQASDSAPF